MENKFKIFVALAVAFFIAPTSLVNAYSIDTTYQLGSNQGSHTITNHRIIIAHDTGTVASARNNAIFEKRTWLSNQAYVQYIVGDGGHVYRIGRENNVAWGAGSWGNANAPVQVELARTNNQATFNKDYAVYVNLLRNSAIKYGISTNLDTGYGIVGHKWISDNVWGDHQDPYGYLASHGISKTQFANNLKTGLSETGNNVPPANSSGIYVDGYWGRDTTKELQRIFGTYTDGVVSSQVYQAGNGNLTSITWGYYGSPLIRAMQRRLGVSADGFMGRNTIYALQKHYGTYADGYISPNSPMIRAMQRALNQGRF